MSTSDSMNADTPARRRKGGSPFLVLAAGLLLFAAAAGTFFLVTRPVTLRIAVGPSGSADQNVIQALSEIFARESRPVRLSLITTAGPVESIELLRGKGLDAVIPFHTMLADLIDQIEVNRNYQKSDLLQIIRILKNYGFLKEPQLELFKPKKRKNK